MTSALEPLRRPELREGEAPDLPPLRIVLITQDDPFYVAETIDRLLRQLPPSARVVGCVVDRFVPVGRKGSPVSRAWRILRTFGPRFVLRYGWRYLRGRIDPDRRLENVLRRHGVPLVRLRGSINAPVAIDAIRQLAPDLLVSILGSQIFKRPLLEVARLGCLNLHSALLPRYRGVMPTFWVLKNGETETGVSVFQVTEGIDTGPILVQRRFPIEQRSWDALVRTAKHIGVEALIEAIERLARGNAAWLPNDDRASTYYSYPTRQDVREFLARGNRFF